MNIEEYVPTITPQIRANEKPLKISPPKKYIAVRANNVVIEVFNVLGNVSLTERLIRSVRFIVSSFFKFSLILS